MNGFETIKAAAAVRGVAMADIGRALGKRDNYTAMLKGRNISVATLTACLSVLDYDLLAVPKGRAPKGSLKVGGNVD